MLNIVAVSIPHTKRHLNFIYEVQDALEKEKIKFKVKIHEDYTGQESFARFMVSEENEESTQDIVELVSKREYKGIKYR